MYTCESCELPAYKDGLCYRHYHASCNQYFKERTYLSRPNYEIIEETEYEYEGRIDE